MLTRTQQIAVFGSGVILMVILGFAFRYAWVRSRHDLEQENPGFVVAERKAEVTKQEAEVKANQLKSVKGDFTMVDLKPYVNLGLEEERPGPKGATNNTLAGLPMGKNVYGGVPFDVEGTVQLMGRLISQLGGENYPVRVDHIKVGKKCQSIHLFHGATFLPDLDEGKEVSRLVLHYGDGSKQTLNIVAGEHVLDWWGPLYTAGVTPDPTKTTKTKPTAANSELAWTGTNGWLAAKRPMYALRLFRTTFKNPAPKKELKSVDYVSAMTPAAPFMVGLTVE